MKLIVSGSRTIWDKAAVEYCLDKVQAELIITEIITGGALGVDSVADSIAKERNIDRTIMFANWGKYNNSAGPRRNKRLANYGEVLLAVWDGKSEGTRDMIVKAEKDRIPTYVFLYDLETKAITRDSS